MKRWISIVMCAVLLLTAFGCGRKQEAERQDLAAIREAGILRIGVTLCPPFSEKDASGSWSGFDVELARAVCEQLELQPEFVELDWAARGEALENGTVDCLWSALTARSDFLETMDFSQTYLASRPVLVVAWEQVEQYQTAEQLKGRTLAVESGSAGQTAAAACLPEAVVTPVASQQAALEAVLKGEAQGAVVDLLVAQVALQAHSELTAVTQVELGTEELAVGLGHGSDLTGELNWALEALRQAGTLDVLAEQYNLTGNLISG